MNKLITIIFEEPTILYESIIPYSLSVLLLIFVAWVVFVSLQTAPAHTPSDTDTVTDQSSSKGGDNS